MREINVSVIAPNGEFWDLKINPESSRESFLAELRAVIGLDSSKEYDIRGNPSFPLADGATVVIDQVAQKSIFSATKRW